MMGQRSGLQEQLFYAFNLEDHVPQDHLLRAIDRCLDLSNLRSYLAKYYSHTGRPSVDPELMCPRRLNFDQAGVRTKTWTTFRVSSCIHTKIGFER